MIEKFLLKTRKLTESFTLIMIAVMSIIICIQVVARYIFNYTPPWIQPLSLLLMVWIGFMGIAVGFQDDSHIKITLFVDKMPKRLQKWVIKSQRLLAFLFGLFMLIEGSKFSYSMKNSFIPGINTPSAILYVVVPIAGLLTILYLFFEFFGKWEGIADEGEGEE